MFGKALNLVSFAFGIMFSFSLYIYGEFDMLYNQRVRYAAYYNEYTDDKCIYTDIDTDKPVNKVIIRDIKDNGNIDKCNIYDEGSPSLEFDDLIEHLYSYAISDFYYVKVPSNDNQEYLLTFYYNKDSLKNKGIAPEDLVVLGLDKDNENIFILDEEILDTDNNSVSVYVGGNTYCDCYYALLLRENVFYDDIFLALSPSGNLYFSNDSSSPISQWESEYPTGDIIKIADIDWAIKNAPEFHVSTPEQLAGVVFYVNAISGYRYPSDYVNSLLKKNGVTDIYHKFSVYLENDIDLEGYDWVPMGLSYIDKYRFSGTVDGQNHSIKNMNIICAYDTSSAFIAHGTNVTLKDINFENINVLDSYYSGAIAGDLVSSEKMIWDNVQASGSISGYNSYFNSNGCSIVGRNNTISFKDCSWKITYKDIRKSN